MLNRWSTWSGLTFTHSDNLVPEVAVPSNDPIAAAANEMIKDSSNAKTTIVIPSTTEESEKDEDSQPDFFLKGKNFLLHSNVIAL